MSRSVQDVTVVYYDPRGKRWEASSPFLPGECRGRDASAAGAVLALARLALTPAGFAKELAAVERYVRAAKRAQKHSVAETRRFLRDALGR